MTRPERRRKQREERKLRQREAKHRDWDGSQAPTEAGEEPAGEIPELELPEDHPSAARLKAIYVTRKAIEEYRYYLALSGLVGPIDRMRRAKAGQQPVVSTEAVLVGAMAAAEDQASYARSDVCRAIAGLDPIAARQLGLRSGADGPEAGYKIIHKALRKIEKSLRKGWVDEVEKDGETTKTDCDLQWFAKNFIRASIPACWASKIKACAVDTTPFETYAVTRVYEREKDTGKLKKMEQDELQKHRESAHANPDDDEPKHNEPPEGHEADGIGDLGPDGRKIRCKDFEARPGHRSATNKTRAASFTGFDASIAVAVPEVVWNGDPTQPSAYGEYVPPFITAVEVTPAGQNPGPIGYSLVEQTMEVCENLREVIGDRAFTSKRLSFNRPLHLQDINTVMDYPITVSSRPKTITVDSDNGLHVLLMHCGTLLPHWIPKNQRKPANRPDEYPDPSDPKNKNKKPKPGPISKRDKNWRYSRNDPKQKNGKWQFYCPVHAGRITYPGSTQPPNPKALSVAGPSSGGPCCPGIVSIPIEYLDDYQSIPWGNIAWHNSYYRRNTVENVFSQLRRNGGLSDSSCPAFGLAPHTIATVLLSVIYNIRLAKKPTPSNMPALPHPEEPLPTKTLPEPKDPLDPIGTSHPDNPLNDEPKPAEETAQEPETPTDNKTATGPNPQNPAKPDKYAPPPEQRSPP